MQMHALCICSSLSGVRVLPHINHPVVAHHAGNTITSSKCPCTVCSPRPPRLRCLFLFRPGWADGSCTASASATGPVMLPAPSLPVMTAPTAVASSDTPARMHRPPGCPRVPHACSVLQKVAVLDQAKCTTFEASSSSVSRHLHVFNALARHVQNGLSRRWISPPSRTSSL